jgi:hypothetical protein
LYGLEVITGCIRAIDAGTITVQELLMMIKGEDLLEFTDLFKGK